eukprot:155567_1
MSHMQQFHGVYDDYQKWVHLKYWTKTILNSKMSSVEDEKLVINSNSTEIHKTLDFTSIIDKLDGDPKELHLSTKKFRIDDLTAFIDFELMQKEDSSDDEDESDDAWPEYNDYFFSLCIVVKYTCEIYDPVKEFADGLGWEELDDYETLERCKKIQVNIRISHENYPQPSQTFEQQLEKMFINSKQTGDTKLVIKIQNDDDDSESYNLYCPPRKKQKINESNNNNKNSAKKKDEKSESLDENDNEDEYIFTNSSILKSASVVFERMLNINMKEKRENKIVVYAKDKHDVGHLVHFMYTNALRVDANVFNLIHMAHYYEMDRLFWECTKRLVNNISVENYVETINIFNKYEIEYGYKTRKCIWWTHLDNIKEIASLGTMIGKGKNMNKSV